MQHSNERQSALRCAKPLNVNWDKSKAKSVVKFIAKLSDGKERSIDAKIMYR